MVVDAAEGRDMVVWCYPTYYGTSGCQAYDEFLPPWCAERNGRPKFPAPTWCIESWCYVDPHNCIDRDSSPSMALAPGMDPEWLPHFSYGTCGTALLFAKFSVLANSNA